MFNRMRFCFLNAPFFDEEDDFRRPRKLQIYEPRCGMTTLDELLTKSASTAFKAVLLVVFMLVVSGILSLVLSLSLLPSLSVCGKSAVSCGLVILAIAFLGIVAPFVMLWCARGYVLLKVLYELFKLHEEPVLQQCAQQICKHRQTIVAAGELKKSKLVGQIPLPVRVLIGRLDLGPILLLLKNNPTLQPHELIEPLKARIEAQEIIQKPSIAWWWMVVGLMLLVASLVWWFI